MKYIAEKRVSRRRRRRRCRLGGEGGGGNGQLLKRVSALPSLNRVERERERVEELLR